MNGCRSTLYVLTISTMQASESPEGQYKDGVRCYMTKEGALVCERLPAGNYRYSSTCPLFL